MAAEVGDVIQITDVQAQSGSQILNVYHYRVDEVGASASYEDMINAFQTYVVTPVTVIQHTSLVHTGVILKNLTNGIDISEEATTTAGTASGQGLPDFLAAAFRLVRTTAATRHGQKRIGGMSEAVVAGNGAEGGFATYIADVEAAMLNPIEVDTGGAEDFILTPVIVGRYPQGDPQAGRLNLNVLNEVQDVQFTGMTSQNTRKIGRGA